jgi:hypothetical protein
MTRSIVFKYTISAAACIAGLFFTPLTAQAVTVTPGAAGASVVPAAHETVTPDASITETSFTGLTYPDTSAGLSACEAQGAADITNAPPLYGDVISYSCELGDPDSGVYNLWLTYYNPNYCKTC